MPSKLVLQYLPVVARGESIRMLLAHTKTEYTDSVLPFEACGNAPFGQLPVLVVDGVQLPQTVAILRYIADTHNMGPKDPLQAALCQSVAEAMNEASMAKVMAAVNIFDDEKCRQVAKEYRASLLKYLANFTTMLGSKTYFHGAEPGYADFFAFAQLNLGTILAPDTFAGFPAMAAWYVRCKGLPAVSEYLATREQPKDRSDAIKGL